MVSLNLIMSRTILLLVKSVTTIIETNSVGGSNTLNNLVHTNNGSASDIGALEHGATAEGELIGLKI